MNKLGAYLLLLDGGGGSSVPYYSLLIQRNSDSIDPLTTNEFNDLLDELYVTQAQAVQVPCLSLDEGDYIDFGNSCADETVDINFHATLKQYLATQTYVTKGESTNSSYFVDVVTGLLRLVGYRSGSVYAFQTYDLGTDYDSDETMHDLRLNIFANPSGAGFYWELSIDGDVKTSELKDFGAEVNTESLYFGRRDSKRFEGKLGAITSADGCLIAPLQEVDGLICYNLGSGLDGTINVSSAISAIRAGRSDKMESYPLKYGFRQDGTVQIPALLDGSELAADGNPLTNEGTATSGAMHNGAEAKVLGTDAQMLACSLYSPDGLTFTAFTFEEAQAFVSGGNDKHWLKWGLDKYGSCMLVEDNQYDFDLEYTVAMYKRFLAFYEQGTCGGGAYEIAYDEDGTAQYNEDGSLELVLPA